MADPRLHLLQLASPALPVGAYAYSQGLEYALEAGWLEGEGLEAWIGDNLLLGVARLDLPLLQRAIDACDRDDAGLLVALNRRLLAARETRELLFEDEQLGMALMRLLRAVLPSPPPDVERPGYATAFAIAASAWHIAPEEALLAYAFSWLENQVAAATKLVPLGQTAAQQLLLRLMERVPEACATARSLDDADIGNTLLGLALASCAHERQHTRLFRS